MYKPQEIIVVREVLEDPVTQSILKRCPGVPVLVVETNKPDDIRKASCLLSGTKGIAQTFDTGKGVLALVSTTGIIGQFDMPDTRIGCPHFMKLVMATNGCPYHCAWCYLRLTYRELYPFMYVRVKYDVIRKKIKRYLRNVSHPVMFNMGELQDSLALEHLTGTAQNLIPFFGELPNGRLFMLTKSDNVDPIIGLHHQKHTVIAWSINAPEVSKEFEIGAPTFKQRLGAAERVQNDGYRVRLRLDPIVPVDGWKEIYTDAVKQIFEQVTPERITLGTLRFDPHYFRARNAIVGQSLHGSKLLKEMDKMGPMLPPMAVASGKRDKKRQKRTKISVGKYSYPEELRIEIFQTVINEVRKHFIGPVALCKENVDVWRAVGLNPEQCECVCQHDSADIVHRS